MRPSELLDVSDAYAAYCLDSAVGEFGRALEAEIHGVEGKTKQEIEKKTNRLMAKWLDLPLRYRQPIPTKPKENENDGV